MAFRAYGEDEGQGTRDVGSRGGRKMALCIGINDYPRSPLGGCVNDAQNWQRWFQGRGFSTNTLLNRQATRSGMFSAIEQLIQGSRAGDVIAIQYSGHGTSVPATGGDESTDEALVPIDYGQNGLLIDDDLAVLCDGIPAGVNVTFFMDCCHSGTITRLFTGPDSIDADAKVRFLPPDEEMLAAHRKSREEISHRSTRSPYQDRREILFSACKSTETAKERGGSGDFTRYALQTLSNASGLTNAAFIDRVRNSGRWSQQNPQLWSDDSFYQKPLLGPYAAPSGGGSSIDEDSGASSGGTSVSDFVNQLEVLLGKMRSAML